MRKRSDYENTEIGRFLSLAFGDEFKPGPVDPAEAKLLKEVEETVRDRFAAMKYLLGLTVDFAMVAQQIASVDTDATKFRPKLSNSDLFSRYKLVEQRGKKKSNTLTLVYKDQAFGIRKIEELFFALIHGMNRTSYPSAYVYNTGQWRKFEEILLPCFQLSTSARWVLCNSLIDFCLDTLPEDRLFGRKNPRAYLFPKIVNVYERTARGENAGLTLQAIVYGYAKADRPHLSISVDKVRGGSSRQRRFGDVDGYYGIDLELSVEVKDKHITKVNLQKELGTFVKKVEFNRIRGLAIVADVDEDVRATLMKSGVTVLTLNEVFEDVLLWDWRKQDDAVNGMLHYLSHVEQNVLAVQRLLHFIKDNDANHDALAYLEEVDAVAAAQDEEEEEEDAEEGLFEGKVKRTKGAKGQKAKKLKKAKVVRA